MNMIPFIDLQAQRRRLGAALETAISDAVASGQWILGPQVSKLEEELAAFAGVKHVVTCGNGTDAIILLLRAWNIGPDDAVFVPAFTFAATAEAVVLAGSNPVFVDVLEDTFNMDPTSLEAAIALVKQQGKLKPRAMIAVDLFGQPADYETIGAIASRERLKLLCDTAQGFGATYRGVRTGGIGDAAATSFFPAKPLGCYGDGGACFTNDFSLAEALKSLRMHGQGADRYEHVRIGMTSRLDTIQAAVLLEKLKIFDDEIELRDEVATRYSEAFSRSNRLRIPHILKGTRSVWAQYTLQVENRSKLQEDLKQQGVPTAVYYPIPLNTQIAYRSFPSVVTPATEKLSKTVVSLPMHPYLNPATQSRIVTTVLESVGGH
jgi:dTDP-4-amino-4,6-dideoxygalactose transaminase